jgi:hypothetical protein
LGRRRRAPALESDGGELLLVSDGDGVAYVTRRRTANQGIALRGSIASRRGVEGPLEMVPGVGRSGREHHHRSGAP